MVISEFVQVDTRGSSPAREVILEVKNVSKEFPSVKALNTSAFVPSR